MWLFILLGKCAVKNKYIVSVPNFLERMLQIIEKEVICVDYQWNF